MGALVALWWLLHEARHAGVHADVTDCATATWFACADGDIQDSIKTAVAEERDVA